MNDPLIRNNVTVAGNKEAGATMVFVHGFGTDLRVWSEVAAAFAADFRQVLLDNVGAGGSDPAAFVQYRYLSLPAYSRDLIEVCDALAVRDAIMVGHSVGAMIGLIAAVDRPELFSRLVLIGASPRYRDDDGYVGGFTRADLDATYSAVMQDYHAWVGAFASVAMDNPRRPSLAQAFAECLRSIRPDHALTTLCAIFQSDHRELLERVIQPTLIVQTREDVAVPRAVADYLHQHIPDSQLAVIDAVGHLPHVSAPARVIEAMQAFLDAWR